MGSEYIFQEILDLNSQWNPTLRFGQHAQHWLNFLTGGFYALDSGISYKIYSELLNHKLIQQRSHWWHLLFLAKIRSAHYEHKSLSAMWLHVGMICIFGEKVKETKKNIKKWCAFESICSAFLLHFESKSLPLC